MIKKAGFILLGLMLSLALISCIRRTADENKIINLDKLDEFSSNMSKSSEIIGKLDSFDIDRGNNIYIADSGFNKIHKFNSSGIYLKSFGEEGQGPGEFMASGRGEILRICCGNDGKIYVYDSGNNRLSVFSSEFEFIKAYKMPYSVRIFDTPSVNSKGDVFFVARAENKLIHKFNNNMELQTSFLDVNQHLQFPFHRPSSAMPFSGEFDLRKATNSKDQVVAVSNYSLTVFLFDPDGKIINKFRVNHSHFNKDFKEQINLLKKDVKKKEGIILPFYLFIDNTDRILLAYFRKEIENYEIYRYTAGGSLLDVLRFAEKVTIPFQCDYQGFIYARQVNNGEYRLNKYKLKEGR